MVRALNKTSGLGYKAVLSGLIVLFLVGIGVSTDLTNIESILPQDETIQVEGNLDMNQNSIQGFFHSACDTGELVVDINDDGSLECREAGGEFDDDFVQRDGDSMSGSLDLTGNNLRDVNEVNPDGETLETGGDIETDTGTVTSDSSMCIGDQC